MESKSRQVSPCLWVPGDARGPPKGGTEQGHSPALHPSKAAKYVDDPGTRVNCTCVGGAAGGLGLQGGIHSY